jgi:hypothetical protein
MRAVEQCALESRQQPGELALNRGKIVGNGNGAARVRERSEAVVELANNLRGAIGEISELRERGRRHHARQRASAWPVKTTIVFLCALAVLGALGARYAFRAHGVFVARQLYCRKYNVRSLSRMR